MHEVIVLMACRWLEKRVRRYSHIECDFNDKSMVGLSGTSDSAPANGVVPPLLPSLLAACAPSTELSLSVMSSEGKPAIAIDS